MFVDLKDRISFALILLLTIPLQGCKSLKHFWAKPFKHRAKVEWTVKMEDEVESAFWNKYVSTWSYPNVAQVMARIPSFCMWDGTFGGATGDSTF
jgi:hypothetical protein